MSKIELDLDGYSLVRNSELYRLRQAEVIKINEHKWYESERAGYDIGFKQAEIDWIIKGHKKRWLEHYRQNHPINSVHMNHVSTRNCRETSNNGSNS